MTIIINPVEVSPGLSKVANAIGFEIFQDGREVTVVDGVERIHVSPEEEARCVRAAHRAIGVYLSGRHMRTVAIIGSTLFRDAHLEAARIEEMHGNLPLLSIAWVKSKDAYEDQLDERLSSTLRDRLDEIVDRRIDLADEVLVINTGGYIGESTRRHIAYAEMSGKPIRYSFDEED